MPQSQATETGRFTVGLEGLNARESAKRLHSLVAHLPRFAELLKEGVAELKAKKKDLAKAVTPLTPEDRITALGTARIQELSTDPRTIRETADAIISEGYRLRALADEELCEDWLQTQLAASCTSEEESGL